MRQLGATCAVIAVATLLAGACTDDTADPEANEAAESGAATDSVGCSPPRDATPGSRRLSFDDNGTAREYDLSVPDTYDGTEPAPLILDLHGFSSNAAQESALTGLPEAGGERGYVVVTPQALEVEVPLTTGTINTTFWNLDPAAVEPGFEPVDDLGFLDALLDDVADEVCIDTRREYVTGMSNGAGMAMAMICSEDKRFAAAAPVAGVNLVGECDPGQSIPLAAFHGNADPLIPYEGGSVVGQDYEVIGVEERVAELAAAAGCETDPTVDTPFEDIVTSTWQGCPDGTDIVLTTVLGGGHTWPGTTIDMAADNATPAGQSEFLEGFDFSGVAGNQTQSISATELILDFFDSHSASP